MNSHSATQRTRDLLSYCITLNEVIRNHRQSPHLDKGRSLSKWSNSMNILVEYLLARRPPREGITESNHIDSIWSLFMCQLPETLDLLRNISQRDLHPPSLAVEDILERVQFHTMATELLKSYYRRYAVSPAVHIAWLMFIQRESAKSQPSALYETSRPGRKYAEVCTCWLGHTEHNRSLLDAKSSY